MPPRGSLPRRYRPIAQYLAALPADQQTARLTPEDLHAMLGPPSTDSLGAVPHWTVNSVIQTFRGRPGFYATLDRPTSAIIFTRRAAGDVRRLHVRQEA